MLIESDGKSLHEFCKSSYDHLDYGFDWGSYPALWLAPSESVVTSLWEVPAGLTGGTETQGGVTTTIWLSGGTSGDVYEVFNEITTDSFPVRTIRRSFMLRIT